MGAKRVLVINYYGERIVFVTQKWKKVTKALIIVPAGSMGRGVDCFRLVLTSHKIVAIFEFKATLLYHFNVLPWEKAERN